MNKKFGIIFCLVGVFAIVGGLYTWGKGSIFHQTDLLEVLVPWADVILTGPLAIVSGYGVYKNHHWAKLLGLVTAGIFLFGSLLVFITLVWHQQFVIQLFFPAFFGTLLSLVYVRWIFKQQANTVVLYGS